MTTLEKHNKAIAEIREQESLSQAVIAKEIGISETQLSQYLKGIYQERVSAEAYTQLENKIQQWLDVRASRKEQQNQLPSQPKFFDTSITQRVTSTLAYAQMMGDLVIIYGGAGLGKTITIANYKAANPNVFTIEATPTTATMGGIMRAISKACGINSVKGHNDALEQAIIDRLKNTQGLLIIDEAQFLNERGLECARRIAELAGIGLALVGNETVYGQLTGRNRGAEFAQLFSRIGKRVRLTTPSKADVKDLAIAWGIKAKEEQQLLEEIAKKPGALRIVTKVLKLASLMAQGAKQELDRTHIISAWKDLGADA